MPEYQVKLPIVSGSIVYFLSANSKKGALQRVEEFGSVLDHEYEDLELDFSDVEIDKLD